MRCWTSAPAGGHPRDRCRQVAQELTSERSEERLRYAYGRVPG
jgi:hypothetical protein